jgi:hypothetical protein
VAVTVQQQLCKAKVFTIDTFTRISKCSTRTASRRLHQWNAYTSYNHNAKYHALSTVPQFDSYGIWRHNDICFSRHGNLTKTVAYIVGESQEGLDAQSLCSILGVSAPSLYTHFGSIKEISSHRIGHKLVYFSANSDVRSRQIAQRTSHDSVSPPHKPRSSDTVLILVDRIQHPDDTIEQCARRLQTQSPAITPEAIHTLLEQYRIKKKLRVVAD